MAALAMLGAAAILKALQHAGLLAGDAATRSAQAFFGLMVAIYGNYIPKNISRMRGSATGPRAQRALRVSGWAFVLAGLSYAGLALFAPPSIGFPASVAIVGLAVGVTIVVSLQCMMSTRSPEPHSD